MTPVAAARYEVVRDGVRHCFGADDDTAALRRLASSYGRWDQAVCYRGGVEKGVWTE